MHTHTQGVMGKSLLFEIINIMHKFYLFCHLSFVQLGTVCEKSSTMMQFALSEIWKEHAVLFVIHSRSSKYENFRVFGCQSKNRFIFKLIKTSPHHGFEKVTSDAIYGNRMLETFSFFVSPKNSHALMKVSYFHT